MRENGLCAKPCQGAAHGPRAHDGTIIPDNIDERPRDVGHRHDRHPPEHRASGRGPCRGRSLFGGLRGHSCSHPGGTRFEALQPIRQGVRDCFGACATDVAAGLTIRHDNGSQYIGHDFRNEIAWLGAKSSPSLVRAPEGNGCAERFIRTLKENLLWIATFNTMEELQAALQKFKDDDNEHWLIQRHGHRSPNQFRRDAMDKIPTAA